MIPLPQITIPRIWTLSNAVCEGTITEQELAELESLLEADPSAKEFYLEFVNINAEISWMVSARQHSTFDLSPRFPIDALDTRPVQSPILDFLGNITNFIGHHPIFSFVSLLAVFGATLLLTAYWIRSPGPVNVTADKEFVAAITAEKNCQWSAEIAPPAENEQLQAGRKLGLEKGILEITYSNGAVVLLEGPVRYIVASSNSGFLSQGKLTARADSAKSQRFTIVTPDVQFVDLGTEFGVMIDERGHAAAAVFSGKIKAEAKLPDGRWTAPISIRKGEAVVYEAANFTRTVARRSDFPSLQQLPPPPQESPYQRWQALNQDMQSHKDLLAYYDFEPDRNTPDLLLNRAPTGAAYNGKIENAAWTNGRFPEKKALEFKADDAGVRVNLPGKYERLTLIAWVNVNQLAHHFNGILLSDDWNRAGKLHWQIQSGGQVEANIFGHVDEDHRFTSTQSVEADCVDRWCMLAVVIDAPDECLLYKNGDFVEKLNIKEVPAVDIGSAMIGGWNKGDSADKDFIRNLSGRVDELMIFQSVLSAEEIKRIYEAGKP
jgi:hypothetical protein